MSEKVTITSVTANTPVEIYHCDVNQIDCQYVDTVSSFPYTFYVEPPYDENDILILLIDSNGCPVNHVIFITPTPTPSVTKTPTPSVTVTPTKSKTPTPTPTVTPEPIICESYTVVLNIGDSLTYQYTDCNNQEFTETLSGTDITFCAKLDTVVITQGFGDVFDNGVCEPEPTPTPTLTPSPTMESIISFHKIGFDSYADSYSSCKVEVSLQNYYTYKSESDTIPVLGVVVYEVENNSILYNPYNGNDLYLKMKFGGSYYAVQINSSGEITDFVSCS